MNKDISLYPRISVSRFEPFQDTAGRWKPGVSPQKDDLYSQLIKFKDGYYAQLIQHLRGLKTKKEKDVYKQEHLPAFTFSCTVKSSRNTKNIESHTGILVIDIDNDGLLPYIKERQIKEPDYDINTFKTEVSRLDGDGFTNIMFSSLSASGNGVFLMFLINPKDHALCFESIKWEFEHIYGIKIDRACSDVVRLRFCTYDPDAIIRPYAQVKEYSPSQEFLDWRAVQEARKEELKSKTKTFVSNAQAATQIVNTALRMIENAKPGERHTMTRNAARLLGGYISTGVLTLDYARDILRSAVESKSGWDDPTQDAYKAIDWGLEKGQLSPLHLHVISPDDPHFESFVHLNEERQSLWKSFYNAVLDHNKHGVPFDEIDFDSLCLTYGIDLDRAQAIASRLYRQNADEHNFEKLVYAVKLKVFINKRWEIRNNIVSNEYHIRVRGSGNPWKKMKLEDLWMSISEAGMKVKWDELIRIMNTDLVENYNPIQDYFEKVCRKYDGHTDHITKLASYVNIRNCEPAFFASMLKKMLARTVKNALEEQYVNRYVFVLASQTQNTGKSWFIRWLSPWGMTNYYAENPLEDTKDGRIRMSEVMIYNLEELSTINKYDVNRLKATISQGSVRERRPYERQSENFPRRCSFYGSTNRIDFLTDDVNTRWLIFEVDDIDWRYREDINIEQVWAQAYTMYINKEDCELSKEESSYRDMLNVGFREITSEDTLVSRYFDPCDPDNIFAKWMTATDVFKRVVELEDIPKLQLTTVGIGRALKKLGFKQVHYRRIRYYVCRPKNQNGDTCFDVRSIYNDNIRKAPPTKVLFNQNDDNDVPF